MVPCDSTKTALCFPAVLRTVIFARTCRKGIFPLVGEDLAPETKSCFHCLSIKFIVWEMAYIFYEHPSASPPPIASDYEIKFHTFWQGWRKPFYHDEDNGV